MSDCLSDSAVHQALDYLRASAIASHRLGDGLKVSHLASTAIRRIYSLSNQIEDKRIQGEHLLWALILGLYWTVDDSFEYLVKRVLSECPGSGLDPATRDLVSMLNDLVTHPHSDHDWSKFTFPTEDNWSCRLDSEGMQFEWLLGYTFLIELAWYEDPKGDVWREVLEKCESSCPSPESVCELQSLGQRLASQTSLFNGQISVDEDVQTTLSGVEIQLLRGWQLHFQFEHTELGDLLSKIRPSISIEHAIYPSFFSLVHQSRFYIDGAEDQFVSLPRYRNSVNRQPAHVIADKREHAAIEATKELAIASFSGEAPSTERWMRFRMAMLLQLQALRSWDLGEWFRGLQIRGEARIELAKFNYHSMVLDGFFDLLLSSGTTQLDKSEFHKEQFRLADLTTEEQRFEFVGKLLQLPELYWHGVADTVGVLSDAIPESVIPALVSWSLRAEESNKSRKFGKQSFLGMWKDILAFASDPGAVVRPLGPAIIEAARNPMLWQDLHDLFCQGMRYCSNDDAAKILDAIQESDADTHFAQWRFSLAFNALKLRPALTEHALSILSADLGTDPSAYQWLVLNEQTDSLEIPRPESASKKSLRSRILTFLEQRSDLTGPSVSMMSTAFSSEMKFYNWKRADRELTDALCSFLHNEKGLFTDKIDVLRCLRKLVELGPKNQSQRIVKSCLELLSKSVPGRRFGFEQQGPMSNLRVNDDTIPSLFMLLLDVIQAGVDVNEAFITKTVLDWLPTVGLVDRARFAPRIIRLLLSLVTVQASKDDNIALVLVGHVESVLGAALMKNPTGAVYVFQSVLFDDKHRATWEVTKPTALWRRTLLSQWSNHFDRLSAHADPEVRRVTAVAVAKWIGRDLEFAQDLHAPLSRLRQDPRSRVREAMSNLDTAGE